uniref:Circumsporozoite protein n=1 Tax=Plasmodium fieldi TaxID=77518 RepID=H9C3U1_9APIC|nr:circumsporozoite protein [Plasmodium fieldi]
MKNFILLAVSSILLVDLFPTHCGHNVDLSRAINLNGVSFNNVDASSLGAAQVRQSASRGRGLGENPKDDEKADKPKKKDEKKVEPKKPHENKLKQPVPGANQEGGAAAPGANQEGGAAAPGANQEGGAAAPGANQEGGAAAPGANQEGGAAAPGANQEGGAAAPGANQEGGAAAPGANQEGGAAAPGANQGGGAAAPGANQGGGAAAPGANQEGGAAAPGANQGGAKPAGGQGQNNEGANKPDEKHVKEYLEKIRSTVGTEWTPCSVTCGKGVRVRRKLNAGDKKPDKLTLNDLEAEVCTMDKCAGIFNVVSNSLGLVILLVLALFN